MSLIQMPPSPPQPFWDRKAPAQCTVDSGQVLVVHCPEPCGQMSPQSTARDLVDGWAPSKVHALRGPIDVRGAKPGDILQVDILKLEHKGWGWTGLCPGFGLLQDRFPEPHLNHWLLQGNSCYFDAEQALSRSQCGRVNQAVSPTAPDRKRRRIVVPFEPFLGCLGVAPAEDGRLSTIPPRDNAGNLDTKHFGVGSRVHLPVFREGAGLSLGDGHAAQGDGEVGGTAIEAPLIATVRLTVLPGNGQANPTPKTTNAHNDPTNPGVYAELPPMAGHWKNKSKRWLTQASGPDVRQAAKQAVGAMVDRLAAHADVTEAEAAMLCSVVGDLSISQAVNEPNWTVSFIFPLSIFSPIPSPRN